MTTFVRYQISFLLSFILLGVVVYIGFIIYMGNKENVKIHVIKQHSPVKYIRDQISSYTYKRRLQGKYHDLLIKDVNCPALMKKMVDDMDYQNPLPPANVPKDMVGAFGLYGNCPITGRWFFHSGKAKALGKRVYTKTDISAYMDKIRGKKEYAPYNQKLEPFLRRYCEMVKNAHVLVVGTEQPWIESLLLVLGAKKVTTLEYTPRKFKHDQLEVIEPKDFYKRDEKYDVAVSYSSIEHSGLGRYGDKLNPYGDLEVMGQVWCKLKKRAHFILAVPFPMVGNRCHVMWNAGRFYGPPRLVHLTANYKVKQQDRDAAHLLFLLQKVSLGQSS